MFDNIIGQENTKNKLGFFLDGYKTSRHVPHLIFVAPKGQGKTTIAKEMARSLVLFDEDKNPVYRPDGTIKKKPFIEVNCSTLKNVNQFINGLVIPYIQDKDVTVLFDEASELPKSITMALLTVLNPNPELRTQLNHEEYVCDFDFRRQTILFATSESHKVFSPLLDRLERITLDEYTPVHLSKIVKKGTERLFIHDDVLMDIATILRGNARSAQMMANKINIYCSPRGINEFTAQHWMELKGILNIFPLGLNNLEIELLRHVAMQSDGISLTALASRIGMSRESTQRDIELYLLRQNLMEVDVGGRILTRKGVEYLKKLDEGGLVKK